MRRPFLEDLGRSRHKKGSSSREMKGMCGCCCRGGPPLNKNDGVPVFVCTLKGRDKKRYIVRTGSQCLSVHCLYLVYTLVCTLLLLLLLQLLLLLLLLLLSLSLSLSLLLLLFFWVHGYFHRLVAGTLGIESRASLLGLIELPNREPSHGLKHHFPHQSIMTIFNAVSIPHSHMMKLIIYSNINYIYIYKYKYLIISLNTIYVASS